MRTIPIKTRIRVVLSVFLFCLLGSGLTALPLETEIKWLKDLAHSSAAAGMFPTGVTGWIGRVHEGLSLTNAKYPFMAYGTDWLAFAHVVIAVAFIGPLRDPVKNVWVIEWGMIACVLIVPFAVLMGGVRGIPYTWRLIDCSFGLFGIIPLWLCRRWIKGLVALQGSEQGLRNRAPAQ